MDDSSANPVVATPGELVDGVWTRRFGVRIDAGVVWCDSEEEAGLWAGSQPNDPPIVNGWVWYGPPSDQLPDPVAQRNYRELVRLTCLQLAVAEGDEPPSDDDIDEIADDEFFRALIDVMRAQIGTSQVLDADDRVMLTDAGKAAMEVQLLRAQLHALEIQSLRGAQ